MGLIYIYSNTTSPQPQLATCCVEVGTKLRERRGGRTLGEDISKLGGGRDMENPNVADSNPVVDLHMLRPLMLNRVGEVHVADVVTVDKCGLGERAPELTQELLKPGRLCHAVSNSPVLRFGTGAGDNRLPLGRLGDEVTT
jgi:hypothetical protein